MPSVMERSGISGAAIRPCKCSKQASFIQFKHALGISMVVDSPEVAERT